MTLRAFLQLKKGVDEGIKIDRRDDGWDKGEVFNFDFLFLLGIDNKNQNFFSFIVCWEKR